MNAHRSCPPVHMQIFVQPSKGKAMKSIKGESFSSFSFIIGSFFIYLHRITEGSAAKLRKKLVKVKRFWKINAFRPKIKAIKGKTRNFKLKEKAN